MKEAETYFEQVPKTIVEKILAQQTAPPKKDLTENGRVAGPAAVKAVAPALRSRKVERDQSVMRQHGQVTRANKERA
jgi:hypothetical protein